MRWERSLSESTARIQEASLKSQLLGFRVEEVEDYLGLAFRVEDDFGFRV